MAWWSGPLPRPLVNRKFCVGANHLIRMRAWEQIFGQIGKNMSCLSLSFSLTHPSTHPPFLLKWLAPAHLLTPVVFGLLIFSSFLQSSHSCPLPSSSSPTSSSHPESLPRVQVSSARSHHSPRISTEPELQVCLLAHRLACLVSNHRISYLSRQVIPV